MIIPPYPKPGPELFLEMDTIDQIINWINSQFSDENFENRYFPKFEWFRSDTPRTDSILNIGCGQGRETFALLWFFNAQFAVGIDKNDDPKQEKIFIADVSVTKIKDLTPKFKTQVLPTVSTKYSPEFVDELVAWYDHLPIEIINGIVPFFQRLDISTNNLQGQNTFDLVYSRYVLDKILDESEDGLRFAFQNMTNVVRPNVGRIVFVVPSEKIINGKQVQYDYEKYIPDDLTLVKIERDEEKLGGSEWPNTNPTGYIFAKQS